MGSVGGPERDRVANNADAASVVGEESLLSGQVGGRDFVVLGRFEGSLELSGELRIGQRGFARAQVRASRVDVEGMFEGEIRAGILVLRETARAKGLFRVERLRVYDGAVLNGAVNPSPAPEAVPDTRIPPPAEETWEESELERWEGEGGPSNL
jgi:cytoskeletal protein CcmA (bactofilin family)